MSWQDITKRIRQDLKRLRSLGETDEVQDAISEVLDSVNVLEDALGQESGEESDNE